MSQIAEVKRQGIELENSGQYVAAAILLEAVVSHASGDAYAWLILSDAYKAIGRFSRCRFALEQALEHCPKNKEWIVFVRFASLAEEVGQLKQAEKWFRRADGIEAREDGSWVTVLRASNLMRLEKFIAAERIMRSAIESGVKLADPDEAYHMLGVALLRQERYAEAQGVLEQANALLEGPELKQSALKALEGIEEAKLIAQSLR